MALKDHMPSMIDTPGEDRSSPLRRMAYKRELLLAGDLLLFCSVTRGTTQEQMVRRSLARGVYCLCMQANSNVNVTFARRVYMHTYRSACLHALG